ncbi:MAG: hypothetical protein IKG42_01770 [Clostridia bacterium]|nr:hypothetical protein [Clostridia bacterium]
MEDASRALLIAAGVLITVLLLAMLLFVRNSISEYKSAENEAELIKQNKEFNSKYEAYNKSFMYGTDIISVVGMAADNNRYYYNEYEDSPDLAEDYFIDIEIQIGSAGIVGRRIEYVYDSAEKKYKYKGTYNTDPNNSIRSESKITLKGSSESGSYGNKYNPIQFEDLVKRADSNPTKKYASDYKSYSITYSWVNDFRRRAFLCEGVEYNGITGRVRKMIFREQELDEGTYDYNT